MLHVHRAERADGLAVALGALLATPLADPFAAEVVAVPARGMERWLTQQLSARLGARPGRRDGVCANIAFPSPRELIADAVATASGIVPDGDPWRPERMVWPLLEVVEHGLGEPWATGLATHLGYGANPPDPYREARRLSTVRHLAALFDRYALHRPGLVEAWAAGSRAAETGPGDAVRPDNAVLRAGATAFVPPPPSSAAWQSELWRRLRSRIELPDPAARVAAACATIRRSPERLGLPERVSLFGLTRLPAGYLDVLHALAAARELHLFILHPSPKLWQAVGEALDEPPSPRRSDDATAELARHPLLRSWGRDVRELQLVLSGAANPGEDHHHELPEPEPASLLALIQADVRADRRPPGAPLPGQAERRPELDPDDGSLRVHACHGRVRQVEVVRDAILHALAADPALEPRDVIVMCPDIEAFAPLVQATFGAVGHAGIDLPVRLADRSLRQTNPLLGVVSALLGLADGRVSASQVLDLADREPVRRRFRLDDDAIGRLQAWIADAGIRWGLDAAHRAPFKLERVAGGTWQAGLDRLLLGVTMTEDAQRRYAGVLPLDDVDSGAIELAGRLTELVARLRTALDSLTGAQPLAAWVAAIAHAADALARPAPGEAWQRAQLQRLLDELLGEAAAAGDTALRLAEVRALIAERLEGRPTRANFRTGSLTVCTLVPMRSVPHRVVCLLGLDDGAFPRKAPRDGDDVLLEDPRIGERDPRSEDRQLLLDALMAARERLIVTYTGNDERTNTPQPPAVPVGELLDVVDATVRGADGAVRDQVLIRHPLQAFDPRNFTSDALVPGAPWSFDAVTLRGAEATLAPRREPRPFLDGPLPPLDAAGFELEDLLRFVGHPVRAFMRRRLSLSVGDRSGRLADALSIELDPLEEWGVGQRLLAARLAGITRLEARRAEIARGTLPPGMLGHPVIGRVEPIAEAIAQAALALQEPGQAPRPLDVHLVLPGGRTLTGTVPGVSGTTLVSSAYSRLAARHRITAWVRLLALSAADPAVAFTAASVGRGSDGAAVQRIRALSEDPAHRRRVAEEQLLALLDLYSRGMREPLPIYCRSSAAYAGAVAARADPVAAAAREWTSEWNYPKEDREREHVLVLGGALTLEQVMAAGPACDEHGAGWDPSETSRFGRLACRLWDGLLEHEELG